MAHGSDSTYPTPTHGTKSSWMERTLDRKADKDWVEAKLESSKTSVDNVKEELDETKKIALAARKKAAMPHDCNQKEIIEKTAATVEGWAKWWRGILISVIGFLVVVGSSWLYQYFTLTTEVATTKDSVEELKITVKKIESSQIELKQVFEESEIMQRRQAEKHVNAVRDVMKEVMREVAKEKEIVRRRGG